HSPTAIRKPASRKLRSETKPACTARRTCPMYWLGIDVGTGGTRALLVDSGGRLRAACSAPHEEMRMERPLWAEQRPEDWWRACVEAVRGVLAEAGVTGKDVRGVGLSGQMHGLTLLDESGEPLRPALIWCDQRSQ